MTSYDIIDFIRNIFCPNFRKLLEFETGYFMWHNIIVWPICWQYYAKIIKSLEFETGCLVWHNILV